MPRRRIALILFRNSPHILALAVALALIGGAGRATAAQVAEYSKLWGRDGELWNPRGRLPDFSHAGYHGGDDPLPSPPVKANVEDFGARGNDDKDDTAAFEKAIAAVKDGAVFIPPGRYILKKQLVIDKPGVVLRGAGPQQTTLFFPIPLKQLEPRPVRNSGGTPTSAYSWSGGLVSVEGNIERRTMAKVSGDVPRGTRELAVQWTGDTRPEPGQRVEIVQEDPGDESLINYIYAGDPGDTRNVSSTGSTATFVARAQRVEGDRLILDRPLRIEIRTAWNPRVRTYEATVSEAGIEELTIAFPATPYEGHFSEVGYNGLAFSGVTDCWARNVHILNADSGAFISGRFNTLEGLQLHSQRSPGKRGCTGHHGIILKSDNLATGFLIDTRFIHDLTVSSGTSGAVYANGRGVDLSLDQHRNVPYANLFTALDAGAGTRLWASGGGRGLGRGTGAWATFWNIRADRPQQWPPEIFGPDLMNFVGLTTESPSVPEPDGRWWEAIPPAQLRPQNLYEAQKTRRQQADTE